MKLAGIELVEKTYPYKGSYPEKPIQILTTVYALPGGGSYIPAQFISDDELKKLKVARLMPNKTAPRLDLA
jgi:hypothetical protein